ncbi:TNF receptor-associated factor 4-like [Dysidea avara]|uniref:TNF receptor-associated factor 4-like n=1 Tax=Dysidea avara TaxID=196820 RepID=UPI00332024FB
MVCPVCREKEVVVYINKQLDREVWSLHVMCTNREKGCEWQGELNDINNHLGNSDGCQFDNVKCSNECGKMLQQRYLTSHVETECPCYKDMHIHTLMPKQWFDVFLVKTWKSTRKSVLFRKLSAHINVGQQRYLTSHVETECPYRKVDCQYCHITGEHQFIEGEHKEQCPKLPISCLNKCGVGSLPREDMEAHRKECPLEMVQCAYHNVGCEERMTGKDLEFHKWRNIYH